MHLLNCNSLTANSQQNNEDDRMNLFLEILGEVVLSVGGGVRRRNLLVIMSYRVGRFTVNTQLRALITKLL